MIVLGMKKGEILRGPPARNSWWVPSIIGKPPIPEHATMLGRAFLNAAVRSESLAVAGVPLADVMAELERRTAMSGVEEKAARRKG